MSSSSNPFYKLRMGFQPNVKSFRSQLVRIIKFGFNMSSDYDLATSIFISRITKLTDAKDCTCFKKDKILNLYVYIEETNFETEEKIYDVFSQLLRFFPNTNIDVRVIELYGRNKDELEAFVK